MHQHLLPTGDFVLIERIRSRSGETNTFAISHPTPDGLHTTATVTVGAHPTESELRELGRIVRIALLP